MAQVLLIDDDPEQIILYTMILKRHGFSVVSASTAEGALQILSEQSIPVALIDWDLPGTKGDALVTRIKAQYPTTRTILFSNHMNVDTIAKQCGADAWFRKSDDNAFLLRILTDMLRSSAGSTE